LLSSTSISANNLLLTVENGDQLKVETQGEWNGTVPELIEILQDLINEHAKDNIVHASK
jgi:hypothetical protein